MHVQILIIRVKNMTLADEDTVQVMWQAGGCITVDSTNLAYRFRSAYAAAFVEWKSHPSIMGKGDIIFECD